MVACGRLERVCHGDDGVVVGIAVFFNVVVVGSGAARASTSATSAAVVWNLKLAVGHFGTDGVYVCVTQ